MNEYNAMRIARAEHEYMARSLPTVYEYGTNIRDAEPAWVSKQAAYLLYLLGRGWAAFGKRLTERSTTTETDLQQNHSCHPSGEPF